jgi:hypothetical protein
LLLRDLALKVWIARGIVLEVALEMLQIVQKIALRKLQKILGD